MKIYFRKNQLNLLNHIATSSEGHSTFTLLVGKRKVGKTTLVKQFLRNQGGAYITISSKSSFLQLQDITDYLKSFYFTESFIPTFKSWGNFFEFLFHIAKTRNINVVLDEFHNFELIDQNAYHEFKKMWDLHAETAKLNIIAISSSPDFILRKFTSSDSPLYQLNNYTIRLTPFRLSEVIAIFRLNGSSLSTNEIISIYSIFGGLPKYYFLIERFKLWDKGLEQIMRELIFVDYAPLAFELKELLINEFSRGNKIYLSILQAIANGHCKMSDMAKTVAIPVTNLTKYLFELEKKKRVIKRHLPLYTHDDAKSKFGMYHIVNYFENFWFHFIQPDIISFEMGQYEKMIANIRSKLGEYINGMTNVFLREILLDHQDDPLVRSFFPHKITRSGAVWNRKEIIEISVVDDDSKNLLYCKAFFQEQAVTKIEAQQALQLFQKFDSSFPDYSIEYLFVIQKELDSEALQFVREHKIHVVQLSSLLELLNENKGPISEQIIDVTI